MDIFNVSASSLFASLLWGCLGSAIMLFGWKQKSAIPLGGGLLMVLVSYFVSSALLMSVISLLIMAGMYWIWKKGI